MRSTLAPVPKFWPFSVSWTLAVGLGCTGVPHVAVVVAGTLVVQLVMEGVAPRTSNGKELLVAVAVETVTFGLPDAASWAVGIVAVTCESLTTVVVKAVPPRLTVPPVRPEPFTVRVTAEVAPALAEVGDRELMCGPVNVKLFSGKSHTPRPCVAARSVREGSCMRSDNTATFGKPLPSVVQVHGAAEQLPT